MPRARRSRIQKKAEAYAISLARGALLADGKTYHGRESLEDLLAQLTPDVRKGIQSEAQALAMKSKPPDDPWDKTPDTAITT